MSLHHSRINTGIGWGRGWGTERSACLGLHIRVGARRNTAWKLLPGLPVLAEGLGSGMRGQGPPKGSLSKPKDKASGEDLHSASIFRKQRIFFPSRKKFPIPSALSHDVSLVPDTSSPYLHSLPFKQTNRTKQMKKHPSRQEGLQECLI